MDGLAKAYYKSGNIKRIDTYKNGQRTNCKKYDTEGKLEFDQDYPTE
jgi:antitoxin component YwqK of YwqJK toxin-antitoxin module